MTTSINKIKKNNQVEKNVPLVSVIVLTYNQASYIGQCLDGILMQEVNFSYEILIGDDASEDGTSEAVRKYAEMYPDLIQVFVREKNMGATRNLYDIFTKANGMYIANCEGDDHWTNVNKLKTQVEFLQKNPQYSACTHDCEIVDEYGLKKKNQSLNWVDNSEIFDISKFNGIKLPGQAATLVHINFFKDQSHDFTVIYKVHDMIADRTVILILLMYGEIYRLEGNMSVYRKFTSPYAKNVTTMFFFNNKDVNRMQYNLTRKLEEYALDEFDVTCKFTIFKYSQYLKWMVKHLIPNILCSLFCK